MKLWTTTGLFPDPARNMRAIANEATEFARFIPDAFGFPYIFNDYSLSQTCHHRKYINKYGLTWWIDVMASVKMQPIN